MISAHDVRSLRARLGLTQAEFAHRLGVSPRSIVSWEANGVPGRSEARVLARLEDASPVRTAPAFREGSVVHDLYGVRDLSGALRDFTTEDLLHELLRRATAARATPLDVGGATQTEDLHTVDLRTEYGLAASHDDTGVDPTRGEA